MTHRYSKLNSSPTYSKLNSSSPLVLSPISPHLVTVPTIHLRPEAWYSSSILFFCSFTIHIHLISLQILKTPSPNTECRMPVFLSDLTGTALIQAFILSHLGPYNQFQIILPSLCLPPFQFIFNTVPRKSFLKCKCDVSLSCLNLFNDTL